MTVNSNGEFDPDDKEVILDALMADAKEKFGSDLNDDDLAVIRLYYDPVAERFAEAQIDIADVLSASQLANAEGEALDLQCEQIGVTRINARKATGTARFSRATAAGIDYTIPKGTVLQTDSTDPIEFKTTVAATLASGSTSVDVAIEAVEGGVDGNVGANTITVMKQPPTGIEEVTNPAETSGGANEEDDDELRERAKKELGAGSRASGPALIRAIRRVDGVKSVSIFINDENTADGAGRPAHSFELVIDGGNPQDIADAILETKAAADTSVGGYAGTKVTQSASLPNGQTISIDYSNPTVKQVYVDANLQITDEYVGDDEVRDAIVSYVGGLYSSGNEVGGELGVGDDVLIGEIDYAIRSIDGVYDITSLTIAFDAAPTSSDTTNLAVAAAEKPTSDATDGSIALTTTTV